MWLLEMRGCVTLECVVVAETSNCFGCEVTNSMSVLLLDNDGIN